MKKNDLSSLSPYQLKRVPDWADTLDLAKLFWCCNIDWEKVNDAKKTENLRVAEQLVSDGSSAKVVAKVVVESSIFKLYRFQTQI